MLALAVIVFCALIITAFPLASASDGNVTIERTIQLETTPGSAESKTWPPSEDVAVVLLTVVAPSEFKIGEERDVDVTVKVVSINDGLESFKVQDSSSFSLRPDASISGSWRGSGYLSFSQVADDEYHGTGEMRVSGDGDSSEGQGWMSISLRWECVWREDAERPVEGMATNVGDGTTIDGLGPFKVQKASMSSETVILYILGIAQWVIIALVVVLLLRRRKRRKAAKAKLSEEGVVGGGTGYDDEYYGRG